MLPDVKSEVVTMLQWGEEAEVSAAMRMTKYGATKNLKRKRPSNDSMLSLHQARPEARWP